MVFVNQEMQAVEEVGKQQGVFTSLITLILYPVKLVAEQNKGP
jgi:hypothetical protein